LWTWRLVPVRLGKAAAYASWLDEVGAVIYVLRTALKTLFE
jgi:hypothetical protein